MKLKLLITLTIGILGAAACQPAANTNTAANNRNITLATATPTATPVNKADWSNKNMTREEYDKNRADYEREKGTSTIGQGANDSWLWFKTKAELASIDDLRDSTINVDVDNDMITLKGTVANAAQKAAAEKAAKSIEGQKGVKNELQIKANDSITNQVVNGNTNSSNTDKK